MGKVTKKYDHKEQLYYNKYNNNQEVFYLLLKIQYEIID
jgi:hypothetical protein